MASAGAPIQVQRGLLPGDPSRPPAPRPELVHASDSSFPPTATGLPLEGSSQKPWSTCGSATCSPRLSTRGLLRQHPTPRVRSLSYPGPGEALHRLHAAGGHTWAARAPRASQAACAPDARPHGHARAPTASCLPLSIIQRGPCATCAGRSHSSCSTWLPHN